MQRWPFAVWVGLSLSMGAATSAADETRAAWTASPVAVDESALRDVERIALARCGQGEAALMATARALLARKLAGGTLPELDGIAEVQRAAGEPHPWPRAWAARARTLGDEAVAKLDAWLGDARRTRRCGVASGTAGDGTMTLVVVTVDALADLAPLPTRARTGQWLSLEARLRTAVRGASVVVLDPNGGTRIVPSWIEGATVRARFAAEGPGPLSVQVVADLLSGPRPVIEADVLVDVDPSASPTLGPAPGEEDTLRPGTDDDGLAQMVAAARSAAGLGVLVRDARLDALARAHAQRMAAAHELAHDVGDGDPSERLRQANLDARAVGENVAHAPSVMLAHRAIWRSPSHRMNLLRPDFERIGVAIVREAGGDVWAVELFAGGLRP